MTRAILLTCLLVASSALKIQQNAEAEACPIECKCKKSQFAFLWSKSGTQRQKMKQIEEAKALLAASQREMDDLGKAPAMNQEAPAPTGGGFASIFGAISAPKISAPKKTAEQLTMEIERRQKKVQELEEAQAADAARVGQGNDVADELCCTTDANAERDCAGEEVAGVREWNLAEDARLAAAAKIEADTKAADEAVKENGYFPNRITFDIKDSQEAERKAAMEAAEAEKKAAMEAEEAEKSRAKLEAVRIAQEKAEAAKEAAQAAEDMKKQLEDMKKQLEDMKQLEALKAAK